MGVQCSSRVTGWQLQAVAGWVSSNCGSAYMQSSCGAAYARTQLHSYWAPLAGGGRPLDTGHNTQPGRNRRLRVFSRGALSRLSLRPHTQCCPKVPVNGRVPGSTWPKLEMLQGRFGSLGNRSRIYGPRRAAAGSGNNALAHHLQRPPIAVAYWFCV
ncbi:unnamed protein product [Sphagnum balticum]